MSWDKEDVSAGLQIKKDLHNPNSTLSLFLQSLCSLREHHISKMKRSVKEDNIFKSVGVLEGIDLAINEPKRIIEAWEKAVEFKNEEVGVANG